MYRYVIQTDQRKYENTFFKSKEKAEALLDKLKKTFSWNMVEQSKGTKQAKYFYSGYCKWSFASVVKVMVVKL